MASESPLRLWLGRSMRLKRSRDFARVRQQGRRVVSGCLIANWQALPPGSSPHLGVITTRKLGNAVIRARARRLLREAFRLHQHDLTQPVDLVLVARDSIVRGALAGVERDLIAALRRGGILKAS